MGRREIQAFMAWMKRSHIDPVIQAKYMSHLAPFLKTYKNFILEEMKADGIRLPKPNKKPIRVIAEDDLKRIFESLAAMPGWHGSVARGIIALYFAIGVRPKELREAHLEELDLGRGTFFIRHPKGEGSWASPSTVDIIREDTLPLI